MLPPRGPEWKSGLSTNDKKKKCSDRPSSLINDTCTLTCTALWFVMAGWLFRAGRPPRPPSFHWLSRSATCGRIILRAGPLCVKVSLSAALLSQIMRRFVRRVFVIAHHSAATLFVAQLFIMLEEMRPNNSHAPSFDCSNWGTPFQRTGCGLWLVWFRAAGRIKNRLYFRCIYFGVWKTFCFGKMTRLSVPSISDRLFNASIVTDQSISCTCYIPPGLAKVMLIC